MRFNFLKSKWFLAGGGALLLVLAGYWAREAWHNYQIEREIAVLERQIDALQSRSQELSSLITYYRTPEYKERQARELLGLQKPGEFVVALPATEETERSVADSNSSSQDNLAKWWHYFFGRK